MEAKSASFIGRADLFKSNRGEMHKQIAVRIICIASQLYIEIHRNFTLDIVILGSVQIEIGDTINDCETHRTVTIN